MYPLLQFGAGVGSELVVDDGVDRDARRQEAVRREEVRLFLHRGAVDSTIAWDAEGGHELDRRAWIAGRPPEQVHQLLASLPLLDGVEVVTHRPDVRDH